MKYRLLVFVGLLILLGPTILLAQTPTRDTIYVHIYEVDTAKVYQLSEIYVGGSSTQAASRSLMQRLSLAQIARQDPLSVADLARSIPAANVQTNSRGETLLYLRNNGERQVALFYDGALLNVPWDYRIDLSLLPAGTLGAINVSKGISSVLYGTNTMGGVVNLVSRQLEQEGRLTEITTQIGAPLQGRGVLTHMQRRNRFHYIASIGFSGRDGFSLPDDVRLPFSQNGGSLRTNTDASFQNGLFRGEYTFDDGSSMSAAVLHIDGQKGVAPEGHKDPTISSVRFWRYPNWQNTMFTLSGRTSFGPDRRTSLTGSAWAGRFVQEIDQYASAAFQSVVEQQEDLDWTFGSRVVLQREGERGNVRAAINALTSTHDQVDVDQEADTRMVRTFRQHILNGGAEFERRLGSRQTVLVGTGIDMILAPETGNQPSLDPQAALNVIGGTTLELSSAVRVKAFVASKIRFPTMRERFDDAFGRFVFNPNLKPERSYTAEIGLRAHYPEIAGEIDIFVNQTAQTIDQEVVTVDNLLRRRRINLKGSRLAGIELIGSARPWPMMQAAAHVTATYGRAFDEEEQAYTRKLTERPVLLSQVSLLYTMAKAFTVYAEGEITGQAYSLDEENQFAPLGWSAVINTRISRLFSLGPSAQVFVEVFVRANNLADTVVLPQLGLPAPGRSVEAGLKLSL